MKTDFGPRPHEEAARLVLNKPVVTRAVFDKLLPELRARAFTITGVEGAGVMQRVRDAIAGLPRGVDEEGNALTWDTQKAQVVQELEPYLGEGAPRRAELLMRTHGFQAFQAANYRTAMEDEDTTHLQYLATEDDRVRSSHLALNGVILPKDDPFWDTHLPPWEWGCRCRIRPMNPDLVDLERLMDEQRNPDDRLVIEGPVLEQLRQGTLLREGQRYDVTPPRDRAVTNPYEWHADNLRLNPEELEQRYDPEVWRGFESWARGTKLTESGTSVMDWMRGSTLPPIDRRVGTAPAGQEPLGMKPAGPRTAQEFARERAAQTKALEEENKKRKAAEKGAETASWAPRQVSEEERAQMAEGLRKMGANPVPTVAEAEAALQQSPLWRSVAPETLAQMARLNVAEAEEKWRLGVDRAIYKMDLGGTQNEGAAAWYVRELAAIEEKYKNLRGKLWPR